jgi:hypothetical protein
VELRLADTGPGVAEELREEIFNPFVTTKKTGVGLGLSIVSKIIDGHHGSIHVKNAPGGGAVFTLFFPLDGAGAIEPQAISRVMEGRASREPALSEVEGSGQAGTPGAPQEPTTID